MARLLVCLGFGLCGAACSFDGEAAGESTGGTPVDAALVADAGVRRDASAPDAASDAAPIELPSPVEGTLFAFPHPGITLDGDLSEWGDYGWISLSPPDDFVADNGSVSDAADLSAAFAARYTSDFLYLAVQVIDDVHHNSVPASELWRNDSVQLAFDTGQNGGVDYDNTDDWEFGFARDQSDDLITYRWQAPDGAADYTFAFFAIQRIPMQTVYEIGIPAGHIGLPNFSAEDASGFEILINEADSDSDRDGYLQWQGGVGGDKNPDLFGTLKLWPEGPDS